MPSGTFMAIRVDVVTINEEVFQEQRMQPDNVNTRKATGKGRVSEMAPFDAELKVLLALVEGTGFQERVFQVGSVDIGPQPLLRQLSTRFLTRGIR